MLMVNDFDFVAFFGSSKLEKWLNLLKFAEIATFRTNKKPKNGNHKPNIGLIGSVSEEEIDFSSENWEFFLNIFLYISYIFLYIWQNHTSRSRAYLCNRMELRDK